MCGGEKWVPFVREKKFICTGQDKIITENLIINSGRQIGQIN